MDFLQIYQTGVYRHAQRYRQTVPALWIGLTVSGLVYTRNYFPDGKLCRDLNSSHAPFISLSVPGMMTDFEFDADRENWVMMFNSDAVKFDSANSQIIIDYQGKTLPLPSMISLDPAGLAEMKYCFAEMHLSFQSGLPREILRAELLAASVLNRFVSAVKYKPDPVEAFRELIDKDEKWHFSLDELSRKVGMSRDHLRRAFKLRYKLDPGEYRTRKRLNLIMHLIAYSELSLKEIADHAGMKNVTHLYALLKRNYDETPSEICRKYRKAAPDTK